MSTTTLLLSAAGIALGGAIGYWFGTLQVTALRAHYRKQERGTFNSGWSVMPGSMKRTASLLMLLAGIQIACPIFFQDGMTQWLVSAGVVIGYGWTLVRQLRAHAVCRNVCSGR